MCLSCSAARPPAARRVARRRPPPPLRPSVKTRDESSGGAERGSCMSVCGGGRASYGREGRESDEGPARRTAPRRAARCRKPSPASAEFRNRGNWCAGGHGWPRVVLDAPRVGRREESRVCFRCATSAARFALRHAGNGAHSIDTHRGLTTRTRARPFTEEGHD